MKYLVLELLTLTLLGLIWAQTTTMSPGEAVTTSNSTNTTPTADSGMNGGNNNSTDSSGGNNNSSNSNGTQTTKTPPMLTPMTMKNGQNHVFTSVRLLLGCFVLGALWL